MKEWLAIAGWLMIASALLLFYAQLFRKVRRRNRIAYPYLIALFIAGLVLAAIGKGVPREGAPALIVLAVILAMALGVALLAFGVGRRRMR